MYKNNRFYNYNINTRRKSKINLFIVAIALLCIVFFARVINILKDSKERGAFPYVQIVNLGMPVVEYLTYDEENYSENRLSIANICIKALGIDKLTYKNFIASEMAFLSSTNNISFKDNFTFNPFKLSDESIQKSPKTTKLVENEAIYDKSLKKELNQSKPEVLIYHTHTHENYNAESPDSFNEDTNVVGIGDVLAQELQENYGIYVMHDKTDHCKNYDTCYNKSGETVDWYLKKYGDFKMIIDLHRDSINDKSVTTTEVCGMNAAKIMFVNARNSKRYSKNKELTERIYKKTEELFPTLPRKILTYNSGINAFNQSKSDGCVLFEMGSHTNTPEEAKVTAQCMARVIAEILNK